MKLFKVFAVVLVLSVLSPAVFAKGSGFMIGGAIGITTANQTDMNSVIKSTNTATAGVSNSELGNAWELDGVFEYRTNGMLGLQFRPSFFYQNVSSGAYEYNLTGFTIFPVMRFYLLENKYIKFFTNIGVGWGMLNGEIKEATGSTKFSGNNMGYMLGLGSEFCLFGGNHCIDLEANLRVLSIDRNIVDSGTGSLGNGTITQNTATKELELSQVDFGTTMSGVHMSVGYVYHF